MSVAISIRGIVCGPSNYPINQEIPSIVIKKLHFGHVFGIERTSKLAMSDISTTPVV